jgi:hypothetical protein
MKALRFHGPDDLRLEDVPQPLTNLGELPGLLLRGAPTEEQGGLGLAPATGCHRLREGLTRHPTIPSVPQVIASAIVGREKEDHVG